MRRERGRGLGVGIREREKGRSRIVLAHSNKLGRSSSGNQKRNKTRERVSNFRSGGSPNSELLLLAYPVRLLHSTVVLAARRKGVTYPGQQLRLEIDG